MLKTVPLFTYFWTINTMTLSSTMSSDMNMHEPTHTCLQTREVTEQWVSKAWRHTHTDTVDKSVSPHPHTTETCPLVTYDPHPLHHPNRSWHFFFFPRAQSALAPHMPTSSLVVHSSMFCSSLTFLLLGRRGVWPGPAAFLGGKRFWGST